MTDMVVIACISSAWLPHSCCSCSISNVFVAETIWLFMYSLEYDSMVEEMEAAIVENCALRQHYNVVQLSDPSYSAIAGHCVRL